MVPAEIKLRLEALSMSLGVVVTGLHSARLVEGNLVDCIFDVEPDVNGNGLHFRFPLPDFLNNADHVAAFALWLARPFDTEGATLH